MPPRSDTPRVPSFRVTPTNARTFGQPTPWTQDPNMTTPKTPIKKAARKKPTVKRAQSTTQNLKKPEPTYTLHFNSIEERLKYIYGNMTPEESLEILFEAGILTSSGRLSPEYK